MVQSAATLIERLRAPQDHAGGGGLAASAEPVAGPEVLTQGVEQFERAFDRRSGGFGAAPKFPRPSELLFLLREHARTGGPATPAKNNTRDIALQTLRAMALGGMRDHLGGGFHRYSVDAEWRVPHFEKMLYDQAQLAICLSGGGAGQWRRLLRRSVAEDTLNYVRREMTDSAGGFYSAEDADSVPPEHAGEAGAHKSEGAFYIWRDSEVAALFGDDADVVRFRFGIEQNGNAPHDPQGEFTHKNLLYVARTIEDVARLTGRPGRRGHGDPGGVWIAPGEVLFDRAKSGDHGRTATTRSWPPGTG